MDRGQGKPHSIIPIILDNKKNIAVKIADYLNISRIGGWAELFHWYDTDKNLWNIL